MKGVHKKKVEVGGGMLKTDVEQITIGFESPDNQTVSALRGALACSAPKQVFGRHIKRFVNLALHILNTNADEVKEDRQALIEMAAKLLEEVDLLTCWVEKPPEDKFLFVNQAFLCMSLYNQCAVRLLFETSYQEGENQARGRDNKKRNDERRTELIRERANKIRAESMRELNKSEVARKIHNEEILWQHLESMGVHKKGESLSIDRIRKII